MTNPYNRVVKTPAEKRADQARKNQESAFAQALDTPSNTTLDESDLIKMEYQEGPVGVGTEGLIMPGTSAGTLRTLDGVNQRVPAEAFRESLTPQQQDQFFMPFPMSQPAPVEPEQPWYTKGNLPHVPGLSQVGAAARGIGADILGFMDEYIAQPAGAVLSVAEAPSVLGKLGVPGFTDEFNWNPEQLPGREDWREKYKENIPAGSRLLTEIVGDPLNIIPFGLAIQGIKGAAKLGKGAKATAAIIKQAEDAQRINDPQSLYYRHVATDLAEGQKQIIVVSSAYPEGRRITLQPGQTADEALEQAFKRQEPGGVYKDYDPDWIDKSRYKILPGDASRAEVIQAAGTFLANQSDELLASRALSMGARAMDEVNMGRGDIPKALIASDEAAFVGQISAAERAEILSSYQRMMPKEVSYLDEAGELIPVTRRIEVNPREGAWLKPAGIAQKFKRVGPIVEQVNAPALLPDIFGNNQVYNIIDGNSATQDVVAQVLIGKVRNREGSVVKGFWPTVEGGGPGMFSPEGIQSIVRQIGNHHPNLSNLEFGGKINVRPMASSQESIGSAAEASARRLSDSDIARPVAESINAEFPRLSSLDASRINFAEYEGVNLVKSLDVNGLPKTVDDLAAESRGVTPSGPEGVAALIDSTGPRKVGEPLYSMADDTSAYSFLYAARGVAGTVAGKVPGGRWIAGLWNRAQALAPDDQIGKLGIDTDVYKSIEHARVRTQVMAWWAKAKDELGFIEIRSQPDKLLGKQGIWRATEVSGYKPSLIDDNPAHGTIDDILKDASRPIEDRVYSLTEKQRQYIDDALDMMEDSWKKNNDIGVDVERIAEDYWHRILIGGPSDKSEAFFSKAWKAISNSGPTSAAARKSYQKERMFDDFGDALKEGFVYDTNPATRLAARLDAGIETYADQSAINRLVAMKKADGSAMFITPQAARQLAVRRLGTEKLDALEEGLKGAKDRLDLAKAKVKVSHKAWKDNDTVESYDAYREALAENMEAYADWDKVSKLKKPGYFQAYLVSHITDVALRDEIFKNIDIPQIQKARTLAGKEAANLGTIGAKSQEIFQLFRALMTNLDLAAMGIQGQVLAFRDFRSWATAVRESMGAIIREPYAYVEKNMAVMEEGQRLGAIMRPTEFLFNKTSLGSAPTRIPLFGPAFNSFQRSFEWFIIVGQTEFYKTLRAGRLGGPRTGPGFGGESRKILKPWQKQGADEFSPIATDEARDAMVEFGRAVRNLMGTEDYAILGIRPTQKSIEATVAFAARFMRANISLIGSAMRPINPLDVISASRRSNIDKQSLAAKRAMMQLFAGGMALTTAMSFASTGRPPNVTDPFAPDWMQFTIPSHLGPIPTGSSEKTYFNMFGPLYTYFRTIARVSNIMLDTQDTAKAASEIKNFLSSRAGLPIRALQLGGTEAFGTGARTFAGEDIFTGASPKDIFSSVGLVLEEFAVPIGASGIAEAIGDGRWEGTVTEVFGLTGRSSPYAQMDIMFQRLMADPKNDMHRFRLEEGRETIGSYRDASPYEKEWMEEAFPDLHQRMVEGARGDWGEAGRQWEDQDVKAMVGEDGDSGMVGLAHRLYQPVEKWATPEQISNNEVRPIDGAEYRRQLDEIMTERWIAHQSVADTYGIFQDDQDPPTDPYELAMYEYRELFKKHTDSSVTPARMNWNMLDKDIDAFEQSKSPEIKKYIYNNTGLNRDPKARELFEDKKMLQDYWDKKSEIAEDINPRAAEIHETWKNMSDLERANFVKTPQVNKIMQVINLKTKSWMSQMYQNGDKRAEEFERKLVYWGYETSPITPAGREMEANLLDQLGTRDSMKIPANVTSYPSAGSSPAPAPQSGGSNTPQWLQQVVGAR